jgi:hypothetical protein
MKLRFMPDPLPEGEGRLHRREVPPLPLGEGSKLGFSPIYRVRERVGCIDGKFSLSLREREGN